jgi:hypothetical protein
MAESTSRVVSFIAEATRCRPRVPARPVATAAWASVVSGVFGCGVVVMGSQLVSGWMSL